METEDVAIVGEVVHPIRHCLIARTALELSEIEAVVSHPQANAQCARFIRTRLPRRRVLAGSSTAEAVRMVAEHDGPWAALGNRLAAERYGCEVLRAGRRGRGGQRDSVRVARRRPARRPDAPAAEQAARARGRPRSCSGASARRRPGGWSAACRSSPIADVNLTRIESRPRKQGLGRYMFFADLEGRDTDAHVADALDGAARARRGAARARLVPGRLSAPREVRRDAGSGHRRSTRQAARPPYTAASDGHVSTSASGVRVASRAPAARA